MSNEQIAQEAARGWFDESQLGKARAAILTNQLKQVILAAIERAMKEHRCELPDSIQEALNSGDGVYRP